MEIFMLYPLLFTPVYRDYIWGGEKIKESYDRANTPTPCAESWEVSAHPDGMSVVENGEFKGKSLRELCVEFGQEIMGSYCDTKEFPILIKIIDSKSTLSVQVHPNDEDAERYGGEAKTEMWYILGCEDEAKIYAGLKQGTGPRIFKDALHDKKVEELLNVVKATRDKALFVPGGLVHAIGEGCLIYEVQQNSNTTYRVYDWNRVDASGKGRPLHVQRAMEVIDWHAPNIGLLDAIPLNSSNEANRRERILRCDYFTMERFTLTATESFTSNGSSFTTVFAATADIKISGEGFDIVVPKGRTCLIPACVKAFDITPVSGFAAILTVHL